MRAGLCYVATKDAEAVAADLKKIYTRPTEALGEELEKFAKVWEAK